LLRTKDTSTKNFTEQIYYDFLEAPYNIMVELWVIKELPHGVILKASEKHCHHMYEYINIGRKEHYASTPEPAASYNNEGAPIIRRHCSV
jgi:hypothetical protein